MACEVMYHQGRSTNFCKMVKIKYNSNVKDGNTCTELVRNEKGNENIHNRNPPPKTLQQLPKDIENHLSDLTDHFDSKLESLNNLILKIEKSVINIGQFHDALLEKIRNLEHIVSRMKNDQDVNVQMQEIKDLKQQISLLQTKVSAIQEQKQILISRMNDFDAMKRDIHEMETLIKFNNLETLEIKKGKQKNEGLVTFMSQLIIARVPRRPKKRSLPKNVIARLKFIHLKNKFLKAARKLRFKQHKGQAV